MLVRLLSENGDYIHVDPETVAAVHPTRTSTCWGASYVERKHGLKALTLHERPDEVLRKLAAEVEP
jgi:hypothetical protein